MLGTSSSLDALFLIVAAPFIGSFLGVVVTRLPAGESVAIGRSKCPQCDHVLAVRDLVPMLSWLWQRGHCRHCAGSIAAFYPAIELAAVAVAVSASLVHSGWLLWASCGFGWALLALAAIDFRCFILPDEITLPLIPAGLAAAYAAEPEAIGGHLAGAALGFAAFVVIAWIYRTLRGREGLGFGDAKLLAASGAWVSAIGLPSVVFAAATSGLIAALISRAGRQPLRADDKVPLGTFLCFGTWLVWLFGPLLLMAG